MSDNVFQQVEDYVDGLFGCSDPALEAAQRRADEAGLPQIQVSPSQGKMLSLLVKMTGAKRVLEVGTLGGYSTIWLARGLAEGGHVVTLEYDPHHAQVAQKNLVEAGVGELVEIHVGRAQDTLPQLEGQAEAPFDLAFLDADKEGYPLYLDWAIRLVRPGGVIIADNVVREGAVLDPDPADTSAVGAAEFNKKLAAHPKLDAVVLQLAGAKGHDGWAIAVVK